MTAGISEEVVEAVCLLTRTDDNEGDACYVSIRSNPIALAVKLADIEDNTDPKRTASLDAARRLKLADKYNNALQLLGR